MEKSDKIPNSSENSDAEAYVESIMSTQRITRVDTPMHSGRKRHRSDTEIDVGSTVKKQPRVMTKANRKLYKDSSPQSRFDVVVTSADVHVDGNASLEQQISKLSSDMHMLFSALRERVDQVEKDLEQKITNKVSQVLDKRINSEVNRMHKNIDSKMDTMKKNIRDEMKADLDLVHSKIESLASNNAMNNSIGNNPAHDKHLNIVIRDLPESDTENVKSKVDKLFKDGLRIKDVVCENAERKKSRSDSKPGVIIAKMKSNEDKRKIMFGKKSLINSSQYSNVYIQHDQAQADRVLANNFRAILGAIKSHGLSVRGSRIVPRGSSERGDGPRDRDSRDGNGHSDWRNRDSRDDNRHSGPRDRSREQGRNTDRRDSRYNDRGDGFTNGRRGRNGGSGAWRGAGGKGRNGRYNGGRQNRDF